jgi:hypothetical protein
LDSEWELCSKSVGFRTEIVIYILDSAQKLWYFCWIAYRNSTRSLLHFTQNFCSIPVGFRAEILFYICRILRGSFVSYLLDSVQKFCLISVGFRAQILFDIYWIPHRNSVWYLLDCVQKFYTMPAAFHTNSFAYLLGSLQNLCSGKPATCVALVNVYLWRAQKT